MNYCTYLSAVCSWCGALCSPCCRPASTILFVQYPAVGVGRGVAVPQQPVSEAASTSLYSALFSREGIINGDRMN